jgi:hypothetical protein
VYDLSVNISGEIWSHEIYDAAGTTVIDSLNLNESEVDSFMVRTVIPQDANTSVPSIGEVVVSSRYGVYDILSDTSYTQTEFSLYGGTFDVGGGNWNFPDIVTAAGACSTANLTEPLIFNIYTGTYEGEVLLSANVPGSSEINTVTFQSAPGESPVVTSATGNGFYIQNTDYITIQSMEITDYYYYGIRIFGYGGFASYNRVLDNYIHHTGGYGTLGLYYATNCDIVGNELHNLMFCAIDDESGSNNYVANNIVYNSNSSGICADNCSGNEYYYNSVYSEHQSAMFLTDPGPDQTIVKNNIFFTNGNYIYLIQSMTGNTVTTDYNDLYRPAGFWAYYQGIDIYSLGYWRAYTGQAAHSQSVNPNYVSISASSPDLHIQSNSPVIGDATPITGITIDIDGESRDLTDPDMGADEYTYIPPPPAIEDLVITMSGDTTGMQDITLRWSAIAGAQLYHIYKSITDPGSGYTLLGSTIDTTFTDTSAIINESKSYYYITSDNQILDSEGTKSINQGKMHN